MPDAGPTATTTPVAHAARRLLAATASGQPCPPVRDLIGPDDIASAYAVQREVRVSRIRSGATEVGWKIGLTSPAVQEQLGVDQPDFGVLLDDMRVDQGATILLPSVLQPRIEAEIAFELVADLADGDLALDQIRAAVGAVMPALEIVDSRIADWDITIADTVADNASSGLFVLGETRRPLDGFRPADCAMVMTADGDEVSTGLGTACLGDPLLAVQWLARTARRLDAPLRAGHLVLSGALGPMHPITTATTIHASLTGLGEVSVRFSERESA